MDQNLSLYKIFYITAQTGNISRAAKELFISQPAISKAIHRLEENLGITLFHRSSRGVQLTEEGNILCSHVREAFQALNAGEEELRQITELGIGHLRIGVSTTLCKYVLLPYLKTFVDCYPHVRITIACQSTNRTLELLEKDKIDIGLIARPEGNRGLAFHSLGEIEDIFVASSTYLKNLKLREGDKKRSIFETATFMLLNKENMTRQYIDDYFIENHISVNNMLDITSMDLLIEFAKIGLGVACVIKEFVAEDLKRGSLCQIPVDIPIHKREIGFAGKTNANLSPTAEHFFSLLQST